MERPGRIVSVAHGKAILISDADVCPTCLSRIAIARCEQPLSVFRAHICTVM